MIMSINININTNIVQVLHSWLSIMRTMYCFPRYDTRERLNLKFYTRTENRIGTLDRYIHPYIHAPANANAMPCHAVSCCK